MSNINLLPKVTKKTKNEIIDVSSIASFFLIIFSIMISIYFYAENENFIEEVKIVNSQSDLVESRLVKEISNNKKFVVSEIDGKNIEYMLSAHLSFSKIINYFEDMLTDDVYIKSYSVLDEKDATSVDFVGVIKDYQSIATQLYIIKQMPEVKKINMEQFEQKDTDLDFSGTISFNRDIGK